MSIGIAGRIKFVIPIQRQDDIDVLEKRCIRKINEYPE